MIQSSEVMAKIAELKTRQTSPTQMVWPVTSQGLTRFAELTLCEQAQEAYL